MWRYVKWGFRLSVVLTLFLFLHYTLPQHDIVRITETYNRITTVGANALFYASPDAGTAEGTNTRDIRFIATARPNDKVIVYRNEDTGLIWPPYFKYDSSNLQAEASNLRSDKINPQWVSVTHYGWRIPFFSIYPNAVAVKAVAGPDVRIIPWVNIVVLTVLLLVALMLRRMWLQFRERMLDPVAQDVAEAWDGVEDRGEAAAKRARGIWGRFVDWLGTFRGRPRR
ncbi:MAG: DUF1523 family protein [Phaeovulum sp.]|uniref:DUF1523 family protein n=1 Tax=Phaeovulum sp. TaxID=2934796 RepID=UPI002736518F|nr:DUF1523 family protein [Phaeovulum sp.]MDP3862835.1 DUF1523 family protein [Phaeovulum sp.]